MIPRSEDGGVNTLAAALGAGVGRVNTFAAALGGELAGVKTGIGFVGMVVGAKKYKCGAVEDQTSAAPPWVGYAYAT
jgi:hypothetical protein